MIAKFEMYLHNLLESFKAPAITKTLVCSTSWHEFNSDVLPLSLVRLHFDNFLEASQGFCLVAALQQTCASH